MSPYFINWIKRKVAWSELPESCDALRVDDPKLAAFFLVHNLLYHHLDSVKYYFITTKRVNISHIHYTNQYAYETCTHTHIYNLDGEDRRLVDLVQVLLDPLSSQATYLSMRFGIVNSWDLCKLLTSKENQRNKED